MSQAHAPGDWSCPCERCVSEKHSERKQWKEHHHAALAKAIEKLLHAAGCPTADVDYHNSHGLSVTIDFDDHCDDPEGRVTDKAIFWALGVHEATKEDR
jgi:hypothetical protein